MPWGPLGALATLVTGAVAAFAIYTFGWHEDSSSAKAPNPLGPSTKAPPPPRSLKPKRFTGMIGSQRLYTIRYGDVIRYPGTATRCQATAEGGTPQLSCVHAGRSRFQVVFNGYGVRVYDLRPPNDGFVSDFDLPGELPRNGE